jgi:hypothetical protein
MMVRSARSRRAFQPLERIVRSILAHRERFGSRGSPTAFQRRDATPRCGEQFHKLVTAPQQLETRRRRSAFFRKNANKTSEVT